VRTLAEIGQELHDARESRGRTLDEVAAQTHMKVSHLRAIETGDESSLPEPVYIKSFIRKYALAVGLPGDDLANQYWQTKPLPPPPVQKRELALPWWIFPWLIAIALVGVVIYFMVLSPRSVPEAGPLVTPSPVPTSTPASPSLIPDVASPSMPTATGAAPLPPGSPSAALTPATPQPKSSPTATPTPQPTPKPIATPKSTPKPVATPKSTPAPAANVPSISVAPSEEIRVRLVVRQASWVRVIRDGSPAYMGTLDAGDAMAWTANDNLDVSIGNAGGVEVHVGDRSLGILGAKGEVVRRSFKRGEQ